MALKGKESVVRNLLSAVERLKGAGSAALYQEGLAVDAESVKRTPVDTGRLRATHYVAPPVQRGDTVVVELGNGTDYAVYVHERTDQAHKVGEAKFLQNALNARTTGMLERLQKRTRANLKRGLIAPAIDPGVPTAPQIEGQYAPTRATFNRMKTSERRARVKQRRADRRAVKRASKKGS